MHTKDNFESIVSGINDGLYFADTERRITLWNKAAEAITGYSAAEVVGSKCSDNILVHVDAEGRELCKGLCPLAATIADGEAREADIFLRHKQGHRVPVTVRISPLKDDQGRVVGGIELFSETRPLVVLRERLRECQKLALLDPLTKLPNRRHVEERLAAQVSLFERSGVPFAVMYVDVDGFKGFNDEHGHVVGDATLITMARTMAGSARPFDTIGRWGGDEFVGVLPNCSGPDAERVAQRLCMLVRHSRVDTAKGPLQITASVGVAVSTRGDSVESIISRADAMMYKQKRVGGNGVVAEPAPAAPTG